MTFGLVISDLLCITRNFGLKEMADGGIRCKSMNTRPYMYLTLRVRTRISRHEEEKMQGKIAPLLFAFIIN